MCCFLMYCQFEGWCYEYWFMQSIQTQGYILQSVTHDLDSSRSLMLFWRLMWSKVIENSRKASGFKRKIRGI